MLWYFSHELCCNGCKIEMGTRVKFGRCTLRSNVDLSDLIGQGKDMPKRVTGSVSNPKEYAIYTELGTSKMKPHAMVRGSLPAIEARSEQAFDSLPPFPSKAELLAAANEVIDFAYDTIQDATHRSLKNDPGYVHLQDAWKKEEAQADG